MTKLIETIKIPKKGFIVPGICTDNGSTNVKAIRNTCSSKRTNNYKAGKKLSLKRHELYFKVGKHNIYNLQCMIHLLKCIRNIMCRKGNMLKCPRLELENDFILEAVFYIDIVKKLHELNKNELGSSMHMSKTLCDLVGFDKQKVNPVLQLFSKES